MKNIKIYIALLTLGLCSGCEKFLEKKADMKMAIPSTLEDADALMNNYSILNQGYPYIGELCSDNFMLTYADWNALAILEDRELFIWDKTVAPPSTQWFFPYRVVYNANQVLQVVGGLAVSREALHLKGTALFYRAYAHLSLSELFVDIPRKDGSNALQEAIPYRMTPNIEENTGRSKLGKFFELLLSDLITAKDILPEYTNVPSRPTRCAADALLARLYLYLQDYPLARYHANEALKSKSSLVDFNTLNASSNTPILRFNDEVIFQAISTGSATYTRTRWKVDQDFIDTFDANDLRRKIFFIENADGTFSYKGNYDGQLNQAPFSGLAVDEILLIRAESNVRINKIDEALEDINTLLLSRWKKDEYNPIVERDPSELLQIVLLERRKELIMRQRRWPDLKRLNMDVATAQTLSRRWEDKNYELKPGDISYVQLIPLSVINNSDLEQTKR
ncbi:RagB/SusD family nutrient uptake outer membrane protein [Sphingobacterium olei]|uniref:RagB/SusD family nutrient uptake outer membrane protein n=1 Tax=Sphingobacterium olei TaxID=2571155 RepID=A0A4U0N8W8_9SPHI|nr:RagB/SusD family nutrient uptake outer membrane protein [Sphingobacterium olei]TJZ50063.1 RagB/SusD family nutrient uptake outer membrane protein [Sphingobacterium olei]